MAGSRWIAVIALAIAAVAALQGTERTMDMIFARHFGYLAGGYVRKWRVCGVFCAELQQS